MMPGGSSDGSSWGRSGAAAAATRPAAAAAPTDAVAAASTATPTAAAPSWLLLLAAACRWLLTDLETKAFLYSLHGTAKYWERMQPGSDGRIVFYLLPKQT